MSGIGGGLGSGLTFQSGVLSAFGLAGPAAALGILGGVLSSVFMGDDPMVENPLPWYVNPYTAERELWGLPTHAADTAAWVASWHHLTAGSTALGMSAEDRAGAIADLAKRGGTHRGYNLGSYAADHTVVYYENPYSILTLMALGGSSAGLQKLEVRTGGGGIPGLGTSTPWGDWGTQYMPEASIDLFIVPRIERMVAQWQAAAEPDFVPTFWDLDLRTWPEWSWARFCTLPESVISMLYNTNGNSLDNAWAAWEGGAGGYDGDWSEWYWAHNEAIETYDARVFEWTTWRNELAASAQFAAAVQAAESEAAAQVAADWAAAVAPGAPPAPPALIAAGASIVSSFASGATSSGSAAPSNPTPLVLAAAGALVLLLVMNR